MESTNCNHINLISLLWHVSLHAKVASKLASMMGCSDHKKQAAMLNENANPLACSPQLLRFDLVLQPEGQAQSSVVHYYYTLQGFIQSFFLS